jgi:hypothetical protein
MSPELKKILKAHWLWQTKENNPLGLVFVNEAGNPMEPDNCGFVRGLTRPRISARERFSSLFSCP